MDLTRRRGECGGKRHEAPSSPREPFLLWGPAERLAPWAGTPRVCRWPPGAASTVGPCSDRLRRQMAWASPWKLPPGRPVPGPPFVPDPAAQSAARIDHSATSGWDVLRLKSPSRNAVERSRRGVTRAPVHSGGRQSWAKSTLRNFEACSAESVRRRIAVSVSKSYGKT